MSVKEILKIFILITILFSFIDSASAGRYNITNANTVQSNLADTVLTNTYLNLINYSYDSYIYLDLGSNNLYDTVMNIRQFSSYSYNVSIYETSSFDEDSITWNNKPAVGDFILSFDSSSGWDEINLGEITSRYIVLVPAWTNSATTVSFYGGNADTCTIDCPYINMTDLDADIHFYPDYSSITALNFSINSTIDKVEYPSAYVNVYYGYTNNNNSYSLGLLTYYSPVDSIESIPITDLFDPDSIFHDSILGWIYDNGEYYQIFDSMNFTVQLYSSSGVLVDSDDITYNPTGEDIIDADITLPNNITIPDDANFTLPNFSIGDRNLTINGSGANDFYNQSTAAYNATSTGVRGIFSYVASPIDQLTNYTVAVDNSLTSSQLNGSYAILAVVCPCIISTIPAKIKAPITLDLTLYLVLILMRKE